MIESDIRLLNRYVRKEVLSSEEFASLAEKGYIRGSIGQDKLNIVWLKNSCIRDEFLAIGNKIKLKHKDELKNIKSKYIKMVLENTPKYLRKIREFELQDIFKCNGLFLLYGLSELLDCGRLEEVEEEYKKKAIKTLLITS